MARNYSREYARRQERARERGWGSYSQQRYASGVVKSSDTWRYYSENDYISDDPRTRDEIVKAMYMMHKESDKNYGVNSWHYYLFVDLLGYMTAEEWADHYPTGVRTYGAHR